LEQWTSSCELERLQELDEVALFGVGEREAEHALVVVHHFVERLEAAVVVEAALRVRPQAGQR
jgi:hypothetical protein